MKYYINQIAKTNLLEKLLKHQVLSTCLFTLSKIQKQVFEDFEAKFCFDTFGKFAAKARAFTWHRHALKKKKYYLLNFNKSGKR